MIAHKFIAAGAVAFIYAAFAISVVRYDRERHTGGFISLQGMMSALVTLPVALPLEHWGRKINFRSNLEMSVAILLCAGLFFALSLGTLSLAGYVWNWKPA